jgi:hypothetical protein
MFAFKFFNIFKIIEDWLPWRGLYIRFFLYYCENFMDLDSLSD